MRFDAVDWAMQLGQFLVRRGKFIGKSLTYQGPILVETTLPFCPVQSKCAESALNVHQPPNLSEATLGVVSMLTFAA